MSEVPAVSCRCCSIDYTGIEPEKTTPACALLARRPGGFPHHHYPDTWLAGEQITPILRACWAILRSLAVAGKQSASHVRYAWLAAVLADAGEYAHAISRAALSPISSARASLSSKSTMACKLSGAVGRQYISNRHHDAAVSGADPRPAGHSARWRRSHRMGECQRAACRSRRHVSRCEGHSFISSTKLMCNHTVRHSWPAARRPPEYPRRPRRRGQNGNRHWI